MAEWSNMRHNNSQMLWNVLGPRFESHSRQCIYMLPKEYGINHSESVTLFYKTTESTDPNNLKIVYNITL